MGQTWDGIGEVVALMKALGVPASVSEALGTIVREHATGTGEPTRPDPTLQFIPPAPAPAPDIGSLARLMHKRALKRAELLKDLSNDLAWHMLLSLTADDARGKGVQVSALCIDSGGPPTTALRHIAALVEMGLVERRSDPHDGRRTWLHLTDRGRDGMHALLLDTIRPTPAPIALLPATASQARGR